MAPPLPRNEPMFNIPATVLALIGLFLAVHAARELLPEDPAGWMTIALAFVPARYAGIAAELPGGPVAMFTSPLTHAFVHGDLGHLGINSAWLLAFGSIIVRRCGAARFLAFAAFCTLCGALAFYAVNPRLLAPMVGASGAISGLMGATMRFMFRGLDERGLASLRNAPRDIPLLPLGAALTDRRIVTTTAVWLLVNLLALLGLGGLGAGSSSIAWEAHIGGYAAGLLGFGLFDRPAPSQPPLPAEPDKPLVS